jgi:RNA polymerase sigma-70 factor (ECF subfamily)
MPSIGPIAQVEFAVPSPSAATGVGRSPTAVSAPADNVSRPTAREHLDLVEALGRGEPAAAREVWDAHAPRVRRLLARALGPRPEVDDLTQEVFMRVFSRIDALRDAGALREFVIGVAVNVLRRELRRRWVRRKVFLSDDGALPDVQAPAADPETREALSRCYAILEKLGARERAAFVLRYMEERTLEEVAAGLGVSLRTAKRLVVRSSERVSKHLDSDPGLRGFFEQRQGAAGAPPQAGPNIINTTGIK